MASTKKDIIADLDRLVNNCKAFPGIEIPEYSRKMTIQQLNGALTGLEEQYQRTVEAMKPTGEGEKQPEPEQEKAQIVDLMGPSADTRNDETKLVQCALDAELQSGSLWSLTGKVINNERSQFDLVEEDAKKKMAKNFSKLLDNRVDASLIPEKGLDRQGNLIELRKKSKAVKWSSWEVTARMVQNTSTIFKAIEILGYDVVFPNGTLLPRNQLEKLLPEKESSGELPVKTIQRCLEMATKKLGQIETIEDILACDDFVKDFLEQYREKLEELKEAA